VTNHRLCVGTTRTGRAVYRRAADLLTNTLFEGAGNAGKTTAALQALEFLFRTEPRVPILILDGVGTLAQGLYRRLLARIAEQEASGHNMQRTRARLLSVRVQSENSSGVSFDLLKLRETVDDLGRRRLETYKERAETIVSTLAHMTPGSDEFKLVRLYAPAVLSALIAGHRPVTEFPYLLRPGYQAYWHDLRDAIDRFGPIDCARGCTTRDYLQEQLSTLEAIYAIPPRDWERLVGSTLRHFQWLWQDFAAFFSHDAIDYGAFHDAGGVLLVDSAHADPSAAAMVRRAYYAIRYAHIVGRPVATPSLVVIDEQQGMNADLYAAIVANARNRSDYHWFLYQSPKQLGENGEHYEEIVSVMQTRIYFRPGSQESAEALAWMVDPMNPDRLRLPTISRQAARSHDTSEQHAEGSATAHVSAYAIEDDAGLALTDVLERGDAGITMRRTETRQAVPVGRRTDSTSTQHSSTATNGRSTGRRHGVTVSSDRVALHEQLAIRARRLHAMPRAWAYYVVPGRAPLLLRHTPFVPIGSAEDARRARIAQRLRLRPRRRSASPPARAATKPQPPTAPEVVPATAPGSAKKRTRRVDAGGKPPA